jgi:hypothetical protein
VNGFEVIAADLDDGDWAEGELAGSKPLKWVIQETADRNRQIAYAAMMAARGRITPDDLAPMLGRVGEETLMLGRRGPDPKPSGRHRWRPSGHIRREVARIRARFRDWLWP